MRAANNVRFRCAAVLGALVAAGIFACAGSTTPESASSEGEAIADVVVESGSGASTVTLVGLHEPVYTAFQQSGPDRVIVDLAGVEPGEVKSPVDVHDGTIDEISVAPFATGAGQAMTRVEIALAGPVDYQVKPGSDGLVIELSPLADKTAVDDAAGADQTTETSKDPWAIVPVAKNDEAGADTEESGSTAPEGGAPMEAESPTDETAAASEPAPTHPATTLTGVQARKVGDGSLIQLQADGTFESAVTFTLEKPSRLVVDLPNVKSQVGKKRYDVGSAQVARIRVGAHADKVRVVIDGGDAKAPFDGRRVVPVPTGLLIALGSGSELDDALAKASAEMPSHTAMAPQPEATGTEAMAGKPAAAEGAEASAPKGASGKAALTTIYGVEFDAQETRDRVVVLGEDPVDYLVYEPDPETVVLSIENARIDPEAAVRITPDAPGPVSLVTSFEQPDVKTPEVRVVVKRAPNLKPEVTRRGALLVMDFPRSGGAAAPPPVLALNDAAGGTAPATPAPGAGTAPAPTTAGIPLDAPPTGAPAALAPGAPTPSLAVPGAAPPASGEPPASISILKEGGLMDGKEYVGRRISLDFKNVDVADVLRLIAEVSDLNVIAGDEVKGAVTIRLVDVPWDQALDVILLTKGLGFVRIGNVLRVAKADVLAQEEEARLQDRRSKEKLEDLVVKLQPVNYASVKDVSKMVSQLLTPRGSVNVDKRTNTLIIKDIASVIDEATALVKAVDTMTPQVMIEAKIVEASLDFSREFGAVWKFGTNPLTQSTLGGRDWVFTQGDGLPGTNGGQGNNIAIGNPLTADPTSLINIASSVLNEKFNIEAQLQAAESNGDGKVISSPRLVTLDNSEAQIQQGVSIPFQTFENGDAQLEFVDAVLQLKVTPHITSDKSIIMKVDVSRNAPDDSVFTLTGSPAIAKNQVKTETLVKDGQTLVLGGIYVVNKSERQSRVPYLHKIPFLGMAFKSDEYSDSRKELLIFVTPRIVQTPQLAS